MAKACRDSSDNRYSSYTPIKWNIELVQPPYETFYRDGARCPPKLDKLTGYEDIPPHFPVIFEEYWNRMVKAWVEKNQ
eukprot:3320479-Amphidinium_carterae.2